MSRHRYERFDGAYQRLREEGAPGWTRGDDRAIHRRELLKAISSPHCPRHGRALELGCGAGDWCLVLAEHGFEVTGVDVSPKAIQWARDKADKNGARITFRQADVLDLGDWPDDAFHFILDGFVLHCLVGADRRRYLETARRLLRPGGLFLVHAFCASNEDLAAPPYCDWVDPDTRCQMVDGVPHRYVAEPEELLNELRTAGLTVRSHEIVPIPAKMMHAYATKRSAAPPADGVSNVTSK